MIAAHRLLSQLRDFLFIQFNISGQIVYQVDETNKDHIGPSDIAANVGQSGYCL